MQRQLKKWFKPGYRLFTWIFLVAYVLTLSACGIKKESVQSFRTLDEIKANGTIKVGVYADNIDMQKFDEAVAANIAKELGVKVETVPLSVNERISALEDHTVDLLLANLTVTDERTEKVDFCQNYVTENSAIMTPLGHPLISEEKVNAATIGVIEGTTAVTVINAAYPQATIIEYSSYDELFKALKNSDVTAISTDFSLLSLWADKNEEYMVSVEIGGSTHEGYIAPAVGKGNTTLKNAVDKIVRDMLHTNMFMKISETVADVYLTYDKSAQLNNENGINVTAGGRLDLKDGTYQSDDGSVILRVKGGERIRYFQSKMTLEQMIKNTWNTFKKAKATE